MAYGYWKLNIHNQEAVFQLVFRNNPFKGNFTIACGLGTIVDILKTWRFTESDIDYLRSLTTTNKKPLFSQDFLEYLFNLRLTCDIDATPEGTVVFPHEP